MLNWLQSRRVEPEGQEGAAAEPPEPGCPALPAPEGAADGSAPQPLPLQDSEADLAPLQDSEDASAVAAWLRASESDAGSAAGAAGCAAAGGDGVDLGDESDKERV